MQIAYAFFARCICCVHTRLYYAHVLCYLHTPQLGWDISIR